ncbi:hypothetical protein CF326_g8964 [Tilletia indica]|nr:hypothetical protein CF326_g8964 [Tilletia indica]
MERILIAATGFASIGSAIGGLHYPWKTSIYEELTTSVLKHMQLRAQMYSASSTQPTTPTPVFTNDMRERILKLMRDFLRQLEDRKRLQKGQGAVDDVGSVITGTRLAQVEDYASSMATGLPTSITVMKDITRHRRRGAIIRSSIDILRPSSGSRTQTFNGRTPSYRYYKSSGSQPAGRC